METVQVVQATRVNVADIEEAPWNVNVVPSDKFERLKTDLRAAGPEGCGPIDICTIGGRTFTCDGAHRLRAAKELKWPYLYVIRHPEITDEQSARLFNFKRDELRGTIDPFKLAESFRWFHNQGMKQEDIAKKFGLDISTVSRRMSLLKIDEQVVPQAAKLGLSVSHLEVLASAPAQVQAATLKEVKDRTLGDAVPTVTELTNIVNYERREYKEKMRFQAWLNDKRVKFPRCPECGEEPVEMAPEYRLPYTTEGTTMPVQCDEGHFWSLITGELKEKRMASGSGSEKRLPQHIKSRIPLQSYAQAVSGLCAGVLKEYDELTTVAFSGKLKGKEVDLYGFIASWGADIRLDVDGKEELHLKFKKNETKNKDFSTYVTGGFISSKKDLTELDASARAFLEKLGNLPHGKQEAK